MGCIPFGKIISMAFGKLDGKPKKKKRGKKSRKRRTEGYPEASKLSSKHVPYNTTSPIIVMPPATTHSPGTTPESIITPSTHAYAAVQATEETLHVRFAVPDPPEEQGPYPYGSTTTTRSVPNYQRHEPGGYSGYRYAASPVPVAWEQRREYFGGEYYHYHPTPVREGIYRFATDANRLTTIFSDENPNACSIV